MSEADSDKALRLRDDFRNRLLDLLAPDVFPVEVAHALSRGERLGRITTARGMVLLKGMLATLPDIHLSLPLLPRAYQISSQSRVGVYDCLYVALAERERCDLVTADDRLVRTLQTTYPFIKSLVSLP